MLLGVCGEEWEPCWEFRVLVSFLSLYQPQVGALLWRPPPASLASQDSIHNLYIIAWWGAEMGERRRERCFKPIRLETPLEGALSGPSMPSRNTPRVSRWWLTRIRWPSFRNMKQSGLRTSFSGPVRASRRRDLRPGPV